MGLFSGIGIATGRTVGQARNYPEGTDHESHVLAPAHEHEVSFGTKLSEVAVDGLLCEAALVFEGEPPSRRVVV